VKATATADNPPATASCDARSDTSNESRADGGKSDDGDGDGNDNSAQPTELPEAVKANFVPTGTGVDAKTAAKILTSTAQLPTAAPASPAAPPSLAPQQAPSSGKRYWTPLLYQNNLRYCDSGVHAQHVSGGSTTTSTSQCKEGSSLAGLAINFGQRRKPATNAHVPPATAQQTTHHTGQPPSGLPSYRMSMHVPSGDSADPSSPRASKTAVPATPPNQRASPFTQSFDATPSTARTTPSASSIYSVRKPSPPPAKTTAAKIKTEGSVMWDGTDKSLVEMVLLEQTDALYTQLQDSVRMCISGGLYALLDMAGGGLSAGAAAAHEQQAGNAAPPPAPAAPPARSGYFF
jgi:hypothetical protein